MASGSTTPTMKSISDSKPIKLRSACNSCFAAKVRCDGNKEGCSRCIEKRLECTFSESRVGKVVGKRRKRPMLGPITSTSFSELISAHNGIGNLPSPALTNTSDGSCKRSSSDSSWTSFIAYDDQSVGDIADYEEQSPFLDTMVATPPRLDTDMIFSANTGLPTPLFSPPATRFLSPAELENPPKYQQMSFSASENTFVQPTIPASALKTFESPNDDDETICIKLLSHLKKQTSASASAFESQLMLTQKTNASIRRLLSSKTIRSDYTCQLLLSSILSHLVTLVERLCKHNPPLHTPRSGVDFLPRSPLVSPGLGGYFGQVYTQPEEQLSPRDSMQVTVKEALTLCSGVGDLLKRKPLNGFQTLGRHECLHVELEHRLKTALSALS